MATMDQTTRESTIRVILLDALGLSRASLARFLAAAGFEISGECATPGEVLDVLNHSAADVILLDFDLCADPGEFISTARQAHYDGRFLAVSSTVDARKSAVALKLGASGIFLKSEAPDRLAQAIRVVAAGDVWIDQKVIQSIAGELIERDRHRGFISPRQIDDRERNVLLGILGGLSNRSIGEEMGLSESSVKNVVQRLFHKGGVKTRGQLVRMALEGAFGSQESLRRQTDPMDAAAVRSRLVGTRNSF
jgi:DNA-binding NarL/FixJ family response regulator